MPGIIAVCVNASMEAAHVCVYVVCVWVDECVCAWSVEWPAHKAALMSS